mmetsp:Transcript_79509/g.228182  ORF Transcript_79509/g.228182 Transcript_79509/m.228182 type:complete len:207 (+) Transcript_79509:1313-1933(+)
MLSTVASSQASPPANGLSTITSPVLVFADSGRGALACTNDKRNLSLVASTTHTVTLSPTLTTSSTLAVKDSRSLFRGTNPARPTLTSTKAPIFMVLVTMPSSCWPAFKFRTASPASGDMAALSSGTCSGTDASFLPAPGADTLDLTNDKMNLPLLVSLTHTVTLSPTLTTPSTESQNPSQSLFLGTNPARSALTLTNAPTLASLVT